MKTASIHYAKHFQLINLSSIKNASSVCTDFEQEFGQIHEGISGYSQMGLVELMPKSIKFFEKALFITSLH